MAVVQISRIQVRRGQAQQGSGVPQLASGEFGWAVDTRELYIGNGSVSEGAPAVGNTKILTQYDNLFSVADTYIYKDGAGTVATGGIGGTDVQRTLQQRLDDRVSGRAFGLTGENTQVATVKLQTAIDQLFINDATKGNPSSRVVLHLEPGEYIVDDTIYIPPYATIIGAGSDKTIIKTNSNIAEIFKTVNGSSTPSSPADNSTSTTINQAQRITLKGLTLESTVADIKGLVLDCCKDSLFEDIKISGPWLSGSSVSTSEVGIELNNLSLLSSVVETKNNTFKNVTVNGFSYAVSSDWDTHHNTWSECNFNNVYHGFAFGSNLLTLNPDLYSAQTYGPYNNIIENCKFQDVNAHAIWVKYGKMNKSKDNSFVACGNDGAAEYLSQFSIIKYETNDNHSENDYFSRTHILGFTPGYWTSFNYLPEIEGAINTSFAELHTVTSTYTGLDGTGTPIYSKVFRLPAETNVANQTYKLDYIITSRSYAAHRSGTLTFTCDGYNKTVLVDDDYSFIGQSNDLYLDKIYFDAIIQSFNGDPSVIDVRVSNQMPGDDNSDIEFKVKLKKTIIDATGE